MAKKITETQFQIGNDGRAKTFKTPEEMQKKIDEYFEKCDNNTKTIFTKEGLTVEVKNPKPYTIEGLCMVLGCTRPTLLNYEKKEGYEPYFNTIKDAKMKVQLNKVERGLMGESNPTFAIFDLVNNSDYRNTNSTELTGKDGAPLTPATIVFKKFDNNKK